MAKGYWMAHVDISDPDGYKLYQAANAEPFKQYGAKFLVRAGDNQQVEGSVRSRHVIIEFPSYQQALDCYHSFGYQNAKALREPAGIADIFIVEGYEGIQP
jgi:uncharacterized protein (DUF1330 family)